MYVYSLYEGDDNHTMAWRIVTTDLWLPYAKPVHKTNTDQLYTVRDVNYDWSCKSSCPCWAGQIRECLLRCSRNVKRLVHTLHSKGLSPVCVLVCLFRLSLCENCLLHTSQRYGFSPVWVRECFSNLSLREKSFPHTSHLYGLSPVCIRTCSCSLSLRENCSSHRGQW